MTTVCLNVIKSSTAFLIGHQLGLVFYFFRRALLFFFVGELFLASAYGNSLKDPNIPISHCYHWLNERTSRFLTYKYTHARSNGGELTFFTTGGNGAAAGPGLYCAKTPLTSYSYGDRVIRIDFVDDVVTSNQNQSQMCGHRGSYYPSQAECNSKSVDVLLYSPGYDWYVIKNPQSIHSWSANDDRLIADLNLSRKEADSAAQSHIDITLGLIQAERKSLGALSYTNSTARSTIEDILKNPKLMAKFPPLSLIGMIIASPRLSLATKQQHISAQLDQTLFDTNLSYSDYQSFIQAGPQYTGTLKTKLQNLKIGSLNKINGPVILALSSNFKVDLNDDLAKNIWLQSLTDNASLDSLTDLSFEKNADLTNSFKAAINSDNQIETKIKTHNLIGFISLLNRLNDSVIRQDQIVRTVFERLIKENPSVDILALIKSLNSKSINATDNLLAVFNTMAQTQFASANPIQAGLMLEYLSSKLPKDQIAEAQKAIRSLPLKVNTRLAYMLLEDYRNQKLKLPSFFDLSWVFIKIFDHSIAERKLGKATTNTYRLVLSGFYSVANDQVTQAMNGKENSHDRRPRRNNEHEETDEMADRKSAATLRVANHFLALTEHILKSGHSEYAYIAFQNALVFRNNLENYSFHPFELALDDEAFEKAKLVLPDSFDPSLLIFLLEGSLGSGKGADKADETSNKTSAKRKTKNSDDNSKARAFSSLPKKQIKILLDIMSNAIEQKWNLKNLGEAEKNIESGERKIWSNFIFNHHYSKENRAFADVCSFSKTLKTVLDDLARETQINKSSVAANNDAIAREYCGDRK